MINYVALDENGTEERWYLADSTYRRYYLGKLVEERPFNASDIAMRSVIRALDDMETGNTLAKLRNALNTNRTYLDKVNGGTVTNADHLAQVAALTRQMTGVLSRTVLHVERGCGAGSGFPTEPTPQSTEEDVLDFPRYNGRDPLAHTEGVSLLPGKPGGIT